MEYEEYVMAVERELRNLIPVSKDFSETVTWVNNDKVMEGYKGGTSPKAMAKKLEQLFEDYEDE